MTRHDDGGCHSPSCHHRSKYEHLCGASSRDGHEAGCMQATGKTPHTGRRRLVLPGCWSDFATIQPAHGGKTGAVAGRPQLRSEAACPVKSCGGRPPFGPEPVAKRLVLQQPLLVPEAPRRRQALAARAAAAARRTGPSVTVATAARHRHTAHCAGAGIAAAAAGA